MEAIRLKKVLIIGLLLGVLILSSCKSNEIDNIGSVPHQDAQTTDTYISTEISPDTPHTHVFTSTVISPSCTEDGYTLHICSLCNEQYTDQITQALGHDYKESIKDALCNQFQKKLFQCSVCLHSYDEEIELQGTIHSYVSTVTYPDRENKGYTTHKCKNCTDSYVDNYTDPIDFSVGLAYTKQSGGYYVSGIGTCQDTDIMIPAKSEQGYTVIGIAESAFANTSVKSITVSDGVTDIQTGAFYNCSTLESVTLSKGANPSEDIFSNNPVLTKLTMPMNKPIAFYFRYIMTVSQGYKGLVQGNGSVSGTYYGDVPLSLREVNILNSPCASALINCDMLTKITIAPTATTIGAYAFKNCTGLTEFSIPASVRSIGAHAFASTSISSIVIPDNVTLTINDQGIFENCKQLTQVKLPSKNTVLPSGTFLNCEKLLQLDIPDSVTILGGSVVAGTNIETLKLPDKMTCIEPHLFNGCEKLKEVILPQKLETIRYSAFENCIALKKIEFPQTLKGIEHDAFMGCSSLEEVVLPSGLQALDYAAFKNCTALKRVELPGTLEKISIECFMGCVSLSEIHIPSTVTYIQNSAFEKSGITSITIPESVTKVGSRLFANCTFLKSVDFSGDSTPIGSEMFLGAIALEAIRIPKNVTEIPIRFCQGATSIKTIEFNEGLIVIKDEAFLGCTSIEYITFPTTLKSLCAGSFKGCTSLQGVDFSGAIMSEIASQTGVEWFADCTSLVEIHNYDGLKYITFSMFMNTPLQITESGMTIALGWLLKVNPEELPRVVVVPQGVTKIYDYVFGSCKNIDEVILPEGVTFIGMRIFGESNGSSLIKLTLPDSLSSFSSDTICFLPQIEELIVGKGLQQIEGTFLGQLKTIRFRGTIEEFKQMPWCQHSAVKQVTVICTDGTIQPVQE